MAGDTISTESRISKLGMSNFLLIHFNFVHYSAQVTTWWWSESSHGLIDTEEICISFNEIVLTLGY